MTQKELILLSLLLADTPEDRHGVYPRRRPTPAPPVQLAPAASPIHEFLFPQVRENGRLDEGLL